MRSLAVAVVLVLLFAARTATADADARAKSRALFVQGVTALEDTRPKDALALFEKAYALYPHFSTLYNIGVCHRALGRSADAANAFQRYLDDGGAQVPAQDGARVRTLLGELDAKLGMIAFAITPSDASVTLDGTVLPRVRVHRVEPGEHVVEASAPGMQSARMTVSVRAGERSTVTTRLEPQTAPAHHAAPPATSTPEPAAPPVPEGPVATPSRLNTTFWIAAGVSAAGFATFGIGGILATSEERAYEGAATDEQADRHRTRGKNLAAIADVGLGVGVAAAIVATIIALRPMDDPPRGATSKKIRLSPTVGAERAAFDLAVSF